MSEEITIPATPEPSDEAKQLAADNLEVDIAQQLIEVTAERDALLADRHELIHRNELLVADRDEALAKINDNPPLTQLADLDSFAVADLGQLLLAKVEAELAGDDIKFARKRSLEVARGMIRQIIRHI